MAFSVYYIFYPLSLSFLCTTASARPLSIPQSNDPDPSIPWSLIIACLVSFLILFALLAVKLFYMKHRRLTAIRSQCLQIAYPHNVSLNSSNSFLPHVKATHSAFLALLVGYFGSPACETGMKSILDTSSLNLPRTASLMYRLRRQSKQRFSKSHSAVCNSSKSVISQAHRSSSFSCKNCTEDAINFWPDPSANHNIFTHPTEVRSRPAATVASLQRCSLFVDRSEQLATSCDERSDASSNSFRACTPGDRVTTVVDHGPTSLRLVGVTDATAVPYSFLSAFPPSSYVLSPLTGTRDSLQLSRLHSKLNRKPVSPLPPLPSYSLSQGPSCTPFSGVPPSRHPPANMGSVSAVADQVPTYMSDNNSLARNSATVVVTPFVSPSHADTYTPGELLPRASDPADLPLVSAIQIMTRKMKHTRSSAVGSRNGIASPLRTVVFPEDMTDCRLMWDTPCDTENSAPCVTQTIDVGKFFQSTTNTQYRLYPNILDPASYADIEFGSRRSFTHSAFESSLGDLSTLQTPKFDHLDEVDIGMLGLDRFHWPEENVGLIQSHSSHIKSDSVALTSFWEEGEWVTENNQW